MKIRKAKKEFDKQISSAIRQITGNLITILKIQIMDPWPSQQNKKQLQRIKTLYNMQSEKSV